MPSGRVDLLACSLYKHQEGKALFDTIQEETKCKISASSNTTGNPKSKGDWVMESDGFDIYPTYFMTQDEFDGAFDPFAGFCSD